MLELRDLVKHYHVGDAEPVRAVDGVSLSVAAGELVALYGPSGSGKTTLLMLIAALVEPDSGAVLVDGRDLSGLTDAERSHYRLRELGFVDQTSDLLPGGNVVQNAAMKLWLLEHTRDAEHRIEPLLVRLGLGDRLAHRADQLSMGERQRVMIARALSTGPKLVLADEPTGQPRHPPRPRGAGAARGGLPRAGRRRAAGHPRSAGDGVRRPRVRAARRAPRRLSSPTTCSRPPGRPRPLGSDAVVEHRPPVCGAAESAGRARSGAVRGARDRRRRGAAVRVAGGEHEPGWIGRRNSRAGWSASRRTSSRRAARGASANRCSARFSACRACSAAVPVLEDQASVIGPHRHTQPLDLIATDPGDVHLAGRLLRHFTAAQLVK